MPGRHITDNVKICQELIRSLKDKKGKKSSMIVKIDLGKAHGGLELNFINETLIDARLPMQIMETLFKCIRSGTFRLLSNGELTNTIKPTRSVRQGDPISPYILVHCLKWLSHLIQSKVEEDSRTPVKASHRGPRISHLFFADDLLFFAKARFAQINLIKH